MSIKLKVTANDGNVIDVRKVELITDTSVSYTLQNGTTITIEAEAGSEVPDRKPYNGMRHSEFLKEIKRAVEGTK